MSAALEAIGIFGTITNLAANIFIGRKNEHGWWMRLVSNAVWIAYSWSSMTISVMANAIIFAAVNVYYWRKWRQDRRLFR